MLFLVLITCTLGTIPRTRRFHCPGQPGNPVIEADDKMISYERVPPEYEDMQLWQRVMERRTLYTNYVYNNKKQRFDHSGPRITNTRQNPAMFIFTRGTN